MKDAPFKDIPIAADTTDPDALAAKKRLREVLVGLVGEQRMGGPRGLDSPFKKKVAGKQKAKQPAEPDDE